MKTIFNASRTPGPLGQPGTSGHVNPYSQRLATMGLFPAPQSVANAAPKKFILPALETDVSGNLTKNINTISWPLYNKKDSLPKLEDVEQGSIQNCPLASIIAALAYTPKGRTLIKSMIKETRSVTTITEFVGSGVDGPKTIQGSRYFTVTFPGQKPIDVSDVFYTDEQSPPKAIYMRSPGKVLWPCVLEKAYAKWKGGYKNLGDDPIAVWKEIIGEPKFLDLRDDADPPVSNNAVIRQANKAKTEPMIAAREGSYHGVAVKDAIGKETLVVYDQYIEKVNKVVRLKISDLRKKDPTLLIYGKLK